MKYSQIIKIIYDKSKKEGKRGCSRMNMGQSDGGCNGTYDHISLYMYGELPKIINIYIRLFKLAWLNEILKSTEIYLV